MDHDAHGLYFRWLLQLWHGEFDIAEEIIADDFTGHWPEREVHGREELVAIISETRGMVDDLTFHMDVGPVAEHDLIAARWTGEGTSAEGRMRFFGNDLLRVGGDGRIAEYWVASWAGPAG